MLRSLHPLRLLALPAAALALGGMFNLLNPQGLAWSVAAERQAIIQPDSLFRRVTWAEAGPLVGEGGAVLVDARPTRQFEAGHIPGAVSLPSFAFDEIVSVFVEEHGRDRPVIVYCDRENCDLSEELALRLARDFGMSNVAILEGGYLEWQRGMR